MLGRAKSCLWQVFVRRRPPKQGELRTDVSKATMFQGDKGGGKARGACRPGRDTAAKRRKDLIGLVQSFCLCALIRGLQNLESPFGKVLILLVGSCCLSGLIRGLQNLESPLWEGFDFVNAKPPLRQAESRFAKPRFSLWKGFNFVCAKPPLR